MMTKDVSLDELMTECIRDPNKRELGHAIAKYTFGLVEFQNISKYIFYSYDFAKDASAMDLIPTVKLLDEDARVRILINDDGLITKIYPYCRIANIKKCIMDRYWFKTMLEIFGYELAKKFNIWYIKGICDINYEKDDQYQYAYYIYREVDVKFTNK